MEIIPAIDIRSGKCVRLYQGDYRRETVYSDDPVRIALRWQQEGARRLHVVDLDGAATGEPVNLDVIRLIGTQVEIPLQVGGGVRTVETAEEILRAGVDRLVLGTAAIADPDLITRLGRDLGWDKLVVAVDARGGKVAIRGWREGTSVSAMELVQAMDDVGARCFLYTDISRDGTLTQPHFQSIAMVVGCTDQPVLASGGVASNEHIVQLAALGVEGVIVGSALYTGALDLRSAIRAASSTENGK